MSHKEYRASKMFAEAKVLEKLTIGSFEDLLSRLDSLITEDDDRFGGNAILYATYPDKVIVLAEDGTFHSAAYTIRDGVISFGEIAPLSIQTFSEADIAARGVDAFYSGDSLAEGMRSMMDMCARVEQTPMAKLEVALEKLFSGGKIWKRKIHEHRNYIGQFAWDADYGKLEDVVSPIFEGLIGFPEDITEEQGAEIMAALVVLEGRLHEMWHEAEEAYKGQQDKTSGLRGEEDDGVLSQYEAFVSNYIEYLGEVANFVSKSIKRATEGGCVACAAKVHDEVASRYRDLDLGGRFVRKVASGFTQ